MYQNPICRFIAYWKWEKKNFFSAESINICSEFHGIVNNNSVDCLKSFCRFNNVIIGANCPSAHIKWQTLNKQRFKLNFLHCFKFVQKLCVVCCLQNCITYTYKPKKKTYQKLHPFILPNKYTKTNWYMHNVVHNTRFAATTNSKLIKLLCIHRTNTRRDTKSGRARECELRVRLNGIFSLFFKPNKL